MQAIVKKASPSPPLVLPSLKEGTACKFGNTAGSAARNRPRTDSAHLHGVIHTIQHDGDKFTKMIEIEKTRLEEIKRGIKAAQAKLFQMQKDLGGVNAQKEDDATRARAVHTLENRLHKVLVKDSDAKSKIQQMRREIDSLRQERLQDKILMKKIEGEIKEKDKVTAKLVQAGKDMKSKCLEMTNAIKNLEAQLNANTSSFQNEFTRRRQEADLEFKRSKAMLEETANLEAIGEGATTPILRHRVNGEMGIEEEKNLKSKSRKNFWINAKREVNKGRVVEKVENLEAAFKTIQERTGVKDLDEMVSTILEGEEESFGYVSKITDLTQQVRNLEATNIRTKEEIEKYRGQGERSSQNRQRIKEGLEEEIGNLEKKLEMMHEDLRAKEGIHEALKVITMSAIEKVGCTDEKIVGDIHLNGVTNENFMRLLGIVEQRALELCKLVIMTSSTAGTAQTAPPIVRGELLVPQPPSIMDEYDGSDNEEDAVIRPVSKSQLGGASRSKFARRTSILQMQTGGNANASKSAGSGSRGTRPAVA